jgi:hypothetical protein
VSRQAADDLLADLLANAQGRPLDFVVLRALIEEASEAGAYRALASLGLEDERARRDMDELRELLVTWRDVKRSAWQTAANWIVRIVLAMLMVTMAYRMDLLNLLEP